MPPLIGLFPRKARVLQRTLEPGPHWRLYCTIRRLPFVARRWRRRRRRLAVGSAAGWPTSHPRFGKASAFPKPQPGRASEAAPDPQPLCPIHTGSLSASHPSPTARQTTMVTFPPDQPIKRAVKSGHPFFTAPGLAYFISSSSRISSTWLPPAQ